MTRIISAIVLLVCVAVVGAEAPPSLDTLSEFNPMLVHKYPWIASMLAAIAVLRLTMKPIFSAIHSIVYATPTKRDDDWLAKCAASPSWKVFVFTLDLLASIKLIHPGTQPAMTIPKSTPQAEPSAVPKP